MKSSAINPHFRYIYSNYIITILSTPKQEFNKNLLKQKTGRYLVRYQRKRSDKEDVIAV